MNDTIRKFGHPATLIAEYRHWLVLLRPHQPTLGALVLAAKSDARAFGDLPDGAHAELARATADIETALAAAVRFDRINYLMLMMVDPHVHFHVLPRYDGVRSGGGIELGDAGWPALPVLADARALSPDEIETLAAWLRSYWPSGQ